jgi:hypothetical protein
MLLPLRLLLLPLLPRPLLLPAKLPTLLAKLLTLPKLLFPQRSNFSFRRSTQNAGASRRFAFRQTRLMLHRHMITSRTACTMHKSPPPFGS